MKNLVAILLLVVAASTRALAGSYTVTPLPTDLWDQNPNPTVAYSATGSAWNSTFARLKVRTGSRTATITYYCNGAQSAPYPLGVRVNGVDVALPTTGATGLQTTPPVVLPAGYNKEVEIISSAQGLGSGGVVYGNHLVSVTFDEPATVIAPVATGKVVVYGDSISAGGNAGNDYAVAGLAGSAPLGGWVPLLRRIYPIQVVCEAYGSRRLYDDASTAQKQTQFAQFLAAYGAATYYLAIGTNDWYQSWSAANFGAAYGSLVDKLHALAPAAAIYCQSPTITQPTNNREVANTYGNTLADYRAQVKSVCATRPWLHFVDGTTLVSGADMSADGLHPGTQGNITYAQSVAAILGLQPPASVSAVSLTATQVPTPAAPTVTPAGTAGSTTWSYVIVARAPGGAVTAASPAGSTTTGNASIANFSGNSNVLTWAAVPGAYCYDIYRTAVGTSPTTTGKIGTSYLPTFTDLAGLAGDGTTAPTINGTGKVKAATINLSALPTSSSGLSSGDVWSNSGVLTIVP